MGSITIQFPSTSPPPVIVRDRTPTPHWSGKVRIDVPMDENWLPQ